MELSEEHDGIIELPSGEVGQAFTDWLAEHDPAKVDPVIEIAITPNRPDALGVRGIARDLAARGLGKLKPATAGPCGGAVPLPDQCHHRRGHARSGCEVFAGRVIRGVDERAFAAVAAGPAARHRPAADLGAGGYHELLHL